MDKEEIFQGTYILDGTPMTSEQQREKVLNLMELAGIKLTDEEKENLVIEYEGASDQDGISETQTTEFKVYKPMIKDNAKDKEIEALQSQLEELKKLRDSLSKNVPEEPKITPKTEKTDIEKDIESLDNKITVLEKETKQMAKEYEKSYKKLQEIIALQNSKLNGEKLLSEEEINSIIEEYGVLKLDENRKSVEIKEQLDKRKKQISAMKRKKNQLQDAITKSEALGLSIEEYNDVTSTLRKTNIMKAILAEKGLEEVINKKASDRTEEEKEALKKAKEEILNEVTNYKQEHKETSAIDAIQALYMLETTYNKKGNAKVVKMTPQELTELKTTSRNLPTKVLKPISNTPTYIPGKAPEDMTMVSKNTENNIKDRITIYKDKDQYYATKPAVERFKRKKNGEGVKINGILCYPITKKDFDYIDSKKDTDYSPFILRVEETEVKKEEINVNKDAELDRSDIEKGIDEALKELTRPGNQIKTTEPSKPSATTEPRKSKYHVEEIINELTKDLNIGAKDASNYIASNIKITKKFKEELKEGSFSYNVIHLIPNIAKATCALGRKIKAAFALTDESKETMQEVEKRLNELSEDKIDVLFTEYRGSVLRTSMNNQINDLILQRLGTYAYSKVEEINKAIKQDYANLFVILGQVSEIEKKDIKTLQDSVNRSSLMQQSANLVRKITRLRKDANNYLSGGILGAEKDYEIVAKKLPYIGLGFAKTNDFNNELQEDLAKYGKGLNEALEKNNNEAIVTNFVQLETCYFNNTKITTNAILGKISNGDKYHDQELKETMVEYVNGTGEEREEKGATK